MAIIFLNNIYIFCRAIQIEAFNSDGVGKATKLYKPNYEYKRLLTTSAANP